MTLQKNVIENIQKWQRMILKRGQEADQGSTYRLTGPEFQNFCWSLLGWRLQNF